jgi:CRISPR-associated endonuclease Cas1
MTASPNLSYSSAIRKPGILVLSGYGVRVQMHAGHLLLNDGIADERRTFRLPRVNHGLKRLSIVGKDGFVTLEALRWLGDQKVPVTLLDRDGTVLFNTGPVYPSDARLRRAQGLAHHSGAALLIARELIDRKLAGQEHVARHTLLVTQTADVISRYRTQLSEANCPEAIRQVESQAAGAYWAAWRTLPVNFPKKVENRLPQHWRAFGTRVSPLTGSPRSAVNPVNAMLNYLYAVLESESRLAASVMGLDPGLGVLHADAPARDSLACDLMEAVRPQVDTYLINWITRETLKKESFLEQPDGNCRLSAQLAIKLSGTAPIWGRAVAPVAEWAAGTLWSGRRKPTGEVSLPTRLTQSHKREAKGGTPVAPRILTPHRENLCRGCGKIIQQRSNNCAECQIEGATERLVNAARIGRVAARSPEARAKHVASRQRHADACSTWDASKQPDWLTNEVFSQRIQPLLANTTTSAIRSGIGVSRWYAGRIRNGYRPHPRHWLALSRLVRVSG